MQIKKYFHILSLLILFTSIHLTKAQVEPELVLPIGHTNRVNSAVYNATGSQIVTAGNDKTARIWDAESGELLHTLEGHTSYVTSAVYNATGSQIVTASWDNTARIWDAESGEPKTNSKGYCRINC